MIENFVWSTIIVILLAYILYLRSPKVIKRITNITGNSQIVVIVNKELEMSKGKVLSQFGHAIDALHEKLVMHPELANVWRAHGSAKIALKGTGEELDKAYTESKKAGLLCVKIHDAGRTQVKPGSKTVVAIGPATKEQLKSITGALPLY
ncbi:Peptidyl-tRNA hydrolase protein 2 [Glugoides intestinalis]